jgi:uncharacterized BrkB/YihY/UPF0761 family membrane protein
MQQFRRFIVMKNIRQVLVDQHIGAITIGFVLALAISSFVTDLVRLGASYWEIKNRAHLDYQFIPFFPWSIVIGGVITLTLFLLIAYLLMRWLYFVKDPEVSSNSSSTTVQQ